MVDNANDQMIGDQQRDIPADAQTVPPGVDANAPDAPTDPDDAAEETRNQREAARAAPLDEETAEVLTRIYISRRVEYQIAFYQSRIREFDNNADMTFRWGAIVMSLSTFFAAISLGVESESSIAPLLRLITAMLPAFAALVNSFRQLYQWERQASIYRDTILGLEEVKLLLPDLDVLDADTARNLYPDLVKRAERVFQDEVSQWGQVTQGKEEGAQDTIQAFKDLNLDIFEDDGSVSYDKLKALQARVTAGDLTEAIRIERPETPALTDGDIEATEAEFVDDLSSEVIEPVAGTVDDAALPLDPIVTSEATDVSTTESTEATEPTDAVDDDENPNKPPGTEDFAG